jgi:hypothetical protein
VITGGYPYYSDEVFELVSNYISLIPIVVSALNVHELQKITPELQRDRLSTAVDLAILSFERNEEKLNVEMPRFEFDLNLQAALFRLQLRQLQL